MKAKRMALYLEDPTKTSSLMLRIAAILSLHSEEEFGLEKKELELPMKAADLNEKSELIFPNELTDAKILRREMVYDSKCSNDGVRLSPLSQDTELMIVCHKNKPCIVIDPMLWDIANELEELLDDYGIEPDSTDACKQMFMMLNGRNVRSLLIAEM